MSPSTSTATVAMPRPRNREHAQRSERTAVLVEALALCSDDHEREALVEQVIVVNQVVATAVAARYRGRGVDQDDLDQVALEGLTKAVRRFDSTSGHDLLTYAVPTIRGELQRYFRDLGWTVRPPRRVQELQWQISQAVDLLSQDLGHNPDAAQVVEFLEIQPRDYDAAMSARGCFHPTSLDQPLRPDGVATMADLLPGVSLESGSGEARAMLAPVLKRLPARDRKILYLRFFEELTQAEIGERIGVTQMQVSRLLTKILRRLRNEIGGRELAQSA